jgi:putative nucleotidyltransferase with HDIG domain
MAEATAKKTATTEIRHKLRLLNLLITFVVLSLLFVIMRYLYAPLQQVLNFIPDASMLAIVSIAIVLVAACLSLSRVLSRQVVRTIEDYSERLDSILTITRDIREEIYGDILLDKIMSCSLAITGSDAGSILLLDDNNLVFKIVKGTKATELPGKAIPGDTGIGGWVLQHGQPAIIEDVKKDERYNPSIDDFTGYQTASMLCVPLRTKASPIGVIELLNKKHGSYDERDLEVISYLADQAAISIEKARFYDDQRNYEIHLTDILLDTIDQFMPEKQGHSKRVAKYATIMARALNMPEDKNRRLYFASLLHDIGFLRISPERTFEKDAYVTHPVIGYEMLQPITFYKDIAPYVLYHHERYDGQGYPENLKGDAIPLESRIIAVAEAFDSMVSRASYKVSVNFDLAINELTINKGGQFDPELVDFFVRAVKEPLD